MDLDGVSADAGFGLLPVGGLIVWCAEGLQAPEGMGTVELALEVREDPSTGVVVGLATRAVGVGRLAGLRRVVGCGVGTAFVGVFLGCFLVGSSRVDLQACKLEYSIVSPK